MVRYASIISYDGKDFFGSQFQPSLRTVQSEVERALKNQFQIPVKTYFASRTDKGVHALSQTIHFDLPFHIDPNLITIGLNKRLASDVRIVKTLLASPRFHARHDVVVKTYKYTILKEQGNVFNYEQGAYFHQCNFKKFVSALKLFRGKHDFVSFTKNDEEKDTIKTITRIKTRKNKQGLEIFISARSFLKYMIRIIIGSCYLFSIDQITKQDIILGLKSNQRSKFNYTAPAKGLVLYTVKYKDFL